VGYPTMEYVAVDERQGRFVVEPLETGFGHTLGSAMRGALMRVLPGAAPVAVRVKGATDARARVKGADVADLLAVVGDLAVTLEGREEATLSLSGSGTLRAADIAPADGVTIANGELVLWQTDGPVAVEILIRSGQGMAADAAAGTDWLTLSARYTPVVRVEYEVGSARVGQRTDFDRLVLDVQTDGSIDPEAAVQAASDLVISHFDVLRTDEWRDVGPLLPSLGEDVIEVAPRRAEDEVYIEDLGLGARSYNGLRRAGVSTLADLLVLSLTEIKAIPNFGKKSVDEVLQALAERNLELAPG